MQRLPQLDGIRGLAIAMVMLCHGMFAMSFGSSSGWTEIAIQVLSSGVDLFFVLSGFLITGILLRGEASLRFFKVFYMRRVLRIVPLYYGVLIFFAGILPLFFPDGHGFGEHWVESPLSHFLFVSNFQFFLAGKMPDTPTSVSWSLAVEEHFYLLWPALLFAFGRGRFLTLCAYVIAIAVAVRFLLLAQGASDNQVMIFTFARLDSFACGGALTFLINQPRTWSLLRRHVHWLWPAGLGAALVTMVLADFSASMRLFLLPWVYLAANIGFACLIAAALDRPTMFKGFFVTGSLRVLGRYSYGIYLTNLGVTFGLILLIGNPGQWGGIVGGILFLPLAFFASWGVGALVYHLVEAPFQRWKVYFPYARPETDSLACRDRRERPAL